ncbi:MAG: HAMP domain-containing protein [Peptococcaceae bacterium]|nr:HAMP domain-containing protein [Peptococcaceae bacterium]
MKNDNLIEKIKEKIEFSIRLKLSVKYIKILVATLLAAAIGIVLVFGLINIKESLDANYRQITSILNQGQVLYPEQDKFPGLQDYAEQKQSPVLVFDRAGNLLWGNQPELAKYKPKSWLKFVRQNGKLFIVQNKKYPLANTSYELVIFTDIGPTIAATSKLAQIVVIVMALLLLPAIAAIIESGKGIFRPIKDMTKTVKHISEENLNLRLNVSGAQDELKELALTFNEMMNRIEDNYNRQKQFVSDASHELRTPITVIQGYADMLSRWGKDDPAILNEAISAIKNEAANMKELIDKLLFLARHDNRTFVFEMEEFSLTEMLLDIVKETQIIDSSHKISYDINQEISLFADRNRMKQAIRILMDNALKYTPPGGEINISLEKVSLEDNNYTAIKIKDTGIGMSEEELKHIFDRFYRADQSRAKEKGGHGLGLAIAKIIILGHQGKIKVRSKKGAGSEFTILLPEKV